MEKNLNEQDSLELINEMIAQARNNVRKGEGNGLLFVGYALVFISLLTAALYKVLTPPWLANWAWMLMIPVTIIVFYMGYRQGKKALLKTYIDRIRTQVWVGFVCSLVIMDIILFTLGTISHGGMQVTPLTLVLVGFAQYISGVVYRFKPMIVGAVLFWVASLACLILLYLNTGPSEQLILFALSMIGGFIIPGHLLNRKSAEHV